ncbi:hypothetical protein [Oligella ureolytica]|uniref:Lipoprotein n=1 Tax=Oligella ureolytica TaxID=90244 RepID=A0A7T3BP03_9BURK|nr:hypothetical protein [Oligella ureolytica]QPT39214.1 hypothetical protein I6G29_08485 [Oligella ureolytica]
MPYLIKIFTAIALLFLLAACAYNPSKPRVSAGAGHSIPISTGTGTSAWVTNAVRFYPWSKGKKVRSLYGGDDSTFS